jgi:hypothetical protein
VSTELGGQELSTTGAELQMTIPPPELDGNWIVLRAAGLLPPLVGVRKTISGGHGYTSVGPLRVHFDVVVRELRYRGALSRFVDVVEPAGDGWVGRATFAGREYGRFRLIRAASRGG